MGLNIKVRKKENNFFRASRDFSEKKNLIIKEKINNLNFIKT